MGLDILINGGSSAAGKANVDSNFNVQVKTPGYNALGVSEGGGPENGTAMFSENDPGTITGSRYVKSPETSGDFRLRMGLDTVLFDDSFNATTQNTDNWAYAFTVMTASQPGAGTLNFGTVQGTAATHGAFMRTFQYFPLKSTAPLAAEFSAGQFTAALVTNEEWRMGLGLPTVAGTAPTDGCWLKLTSAGIIGEIAYNGSLTQTGALLPLASFNVGELDKLILVIGEDEIEFWKGIDILGKLAIPVSNGQPFLSTSLPIFMQKICTGAVSNTNTMRVSDVGVSLMDLATNKPWAHQIAGGSQSAYSGGNGQTQGKTSLWTNSAAPTAVALTNTTAAFTGLDGITAVLPTLAANSDGILISYQNPAGTVNITGRNLLVTGITLSGAVSVVLAGGPVVYACALAFGHTAVSLATAETGSFVTATTHSPRIKPIGFLTFAAAAVVGTVGGNISIKFEAPIRVRPGEFVQIILRNIGTVTTTGAITLVSDIDAYPE